MIIDNPKKLRVFELIPGIIDGKIYRKTQQLLVETMVSNVDFPINQPESTRTVPLN